MLISDFISYLRFELNRSALTVEAYERDITQFAGWITKDHPSDFQPDSVSLSDVRTWLAALARDKQTAVTIRRKAQSLRAFFKFLLKRGIISSNPTADLTLPKLPKALPDVVRQEEIEGVLRADEAVINCDPDNEIEIRDDLIIDLLYSLGIRRAELIAISDPDISPTSGEIRIFGKRSKQRVVPVPQALLHKIARWQNLRDRLWPNLESPTPLFAVKGKRMSPRQVYDAVHRQLEPTGARKKSPHALRHSFATSMLNEGADLNSVKEFLGHSSLSTTQIYTHVSFAEMKKAYEHSHPRARNSAASHEKNESNE